MKRGAPLFSTTGSVGCPTDNRDTLSPPLSPAVIDWAWVEQNDRANTRSKYVDFRIIKSDIPVML